jgi:hypothetical protein
LANLRFICSVIAWQAKSPAERHRELLSVQPANAFGHWFVLTDLWSPLPASSPVETFVDLVKFYRDEVGELDGKIEPSQSRRSTDTPPTGREFRGSIYQIPQPDIGPHTNEDD